MNDKQETVINGAGIALINARLDGLEKLIDHRFQEIITDLGVTTQRINERKAEYTTLQQNISDMRERVTKLETAQITTRWLLGLSVAAAGAVSTAVAIFV